MRDVARLRAIVAGPDVVEVRLELGGYTSREDVAWLYGLVGGPVELSIEPLKAHFWPHGTEMGQIPTDGENGPSA